METRTPGYESPQIETPRHTGHEREQARASDYVMESRRNVDSHDKEGGHTSDMHVGKSADWLRKRLQENPKMKDASSFNDKAIANRVQGRFIKENKAEIKEWLNNKKITGTFVGTITMDRDIGIVVNRKGKVKTTTRARVVLGKNNSDLGYRAVTSFPIP